MLGNSMMQLLVASGFNGSSQKPCKNGNEDNDDDDADADDADEQTGNACNRSVQGRRTG